MRNIQINPIAALGVIVASFTLGIQMDEIVKFIHESKEVLELYPKSAEIVGEKENLHYNDNVDLRNPESCHQYQILGRVEIELEKNNKGIENAVAQHLRDISADMCIISRENVIEEYLRTGKSISNNSK